MQRHCPVSPTARARRVRPIGRGLLSAAVSAALLLAVLLAPPPARADSQALLNQMLDTYINVTPAQVFDTQRRGGLTLGSVVTRSHIIKPNLIKIVPPSIKGGCGGIDVFGGSFSFISSEQLQQFLRAIASNALNYAFMLALEGVCPECMQKIEKLRDWVDNMNKNMLDSCHWATKMVDETGLKAWATQRMNDSQDQQVDTGNQPDNAQARHDYTTEMDADQKMNKPTATNAVWDAMQKSGTSAWFGAIGDNDLMEIVMSVTGTVVKAPVDQNGANCQNTDAQHEYCYTELTSLLDVDEFMNGSDDGQLKVYHCTDAGNLCLNPQIVPRDWPGLNARIREILFGPAPGFTGGLLFKLRTPTATYTDAENRFIQAAPVPVYAALVRVAKYDGQLITMGEHVQQLITVQVARNIVLEMIGVVRKSFGQHDVQMSPMMKEKLRDRSEEFRTRVSYDDNSFNSMFSLIQAAREIAQDNGGHDQPKAAQTPAARQKKF